MKFSFQHPVTLLFIGLMSAFSVSTRAQPSHSQNEIAAATHLRETAGIVTCDEDEFLFGVAYIDGSYMERIFLVRDEQIGPRLEVDFRTPGIWPAGDESGTPQELAPMPFTLELQVPLSRYALPSGSKWQTPSQQWQTSLRFKYSNWYGEISRHEGRWKVAWQGFRRPMLPDSVKNTKAEICHLLAEP